MVEDFIRQALAKKLTHFERRHCFIQNLTYFFLMEHSDKLNDIIKSDS